MLSFGCPAGFLPYLPSNSRSNALLLIFPCLYISQRFSCVLRAPVASAKCDFPGFFDSTGVDGYILDCRNRGRAG